MSGNVKLPICAAMLVGLGQPAAAAAYDQCLARSGGVTIGIRDCDQVELKRQDQRLNTAYRALSGRLSTPDRARLTAVQRSWLAFRGLDCDFQASREAGGSLAPIILERCVIELTSARATTLEELLKNE